MPENEKNFDMVQSVSDEISASNQVLYSLLEKLYRNLDEPELGSYKRLHESWENYRYSVGEFARSEFFGGSNAKLSAAVAFLNETNRYIEVVQVLIENHCSN